ncbi:MAG: hypothetical protein WDO56_21655 [Gammaproteobacteria bacterium]
MLVTSVRSGPGDFAIRRIIRIVPLYWVLTLVLIVLALVHPDWFRTVVVRADYVIKSLLFIPYPNPSARASSRRCSFRGGRSISRCSSTRCSRSFCSRR